MRKLISLIVVMAGLWGGYWFVGSSQLEKGFKDYLAKELGPDDPIRLSYSDLTVQGFPNRFDTRITDVDLTNTIKGIRWQAPFFQIYALSYKPYHIIAALAPQQVVTLPKQEFTIKSEMIRGSVVFLPKPLFSGDVIIDRSSFEMVNVTAASDKGWETTIKAGNLALRQTPTKPLFYDLAISAQGIDLPDQLRALIDPAHQQSALFDSFKLDSTLGLSNPLDLTADRGEHPKVTEIEVKDLTIHWDDIRFLAKGTLQIGTDGYPVGKLDLTAVNWQKMYELADQSGAVDPDFAPTIQNGLKVLAGMSEGEDVIEIALNFADGQMSLGPFPIGPAPRLY